MAERITPLPDADKRKRRREKILIVLTLILVVALTSVEIYLVRQGGYPFTGSLLVFGLLNINAILFLLFTFLVFRHLSKLFVERRAKVFGSRLRTRLVLTFISLALIPTLFMFFIAWQLISSRMEYHWDRLVKDTLDQTLALGKVFTQGLEDKLQAAGDLCRRDLESQGPGWLKNEAALTSRLSACAKAYNLTSLEIVTSQGKTLAVTEPVKQQGRPGPSLPPLTAEELQSEGFQRQAVPQGVLIRLVLPLKVPGCGPSRS